MTAWDDYLAAAQRLDAVRRDAAAATAARTAATQAAGQELATVRQRLALQAARLADLAARAGMAPPVLTPDSPMPEPPDPAGGELVAPLVAQAPTSRLAASVVVAVMSRRMTASPVW